jgi:hypothetical protein
MPFEPGNKFGHGRPSAGKSLSDALRIALAEKLPDGRTVTRAIADTLVKKAISGDIQAIREIADRIEGRPAIQADPSVAGDLKRPINIVVTAADLRTI